MTAFGTSLPWLGYVGLSVCAIGIMASFPGFWTLPSVFISGAAAAVGIAVVNSIGNLAGFAGPYWVGWITDLFGEAKWALISIGGVMIIGAMVVLRLGSAPPPSLRDAESTLTSADTEDSAGMPTDSAGNPATA